MMLRFFEGVPRVARGPRDGERREKRAHRGSLINDPAAPEEGQVSSHVVPRENGEGKRDLTPQLPNSAVTW